ncbi:hypothetical protein E2562_000634 [Oryza meyeriana var. granulata]|uniref:Uncharacterized protein n=1 Tax=Oryza meyeriana var. granulata TaxID=110450 RepID=A0A6G1DV75_9ORYZ|nr:hypothetical protein E2562_000634 [Oryza meyeriana var. granulata]
MLVVRVRPKGMDWVSAAGAPSGEEKAEVRAASCWGTRINPAGTPFPLAPWQVSRRASLSVLPMGQPISLVLHSGGEILCTMSLQDEAICEDMPCRWLFEAISPIAPSSSQGKKRK